MAASLAGKIALVTGGSKGIGRATALLLAQRGAKVVITYNSDDKAAQDVVATAGADNVTAIKSNAASVAESTSLVEQTVSKFGKIDILIANAGILPYKDLASTTEEDYDQTFDINVKGPYFLVQKAAPHIPSGGKVLFFSTSLTAASGVMPRYLLYLATKGAVEQMVRVISKELAPKGISVNAVSPGPTDTDLFNRGMNEQALNFVKGMIPRGRIGKPEDIAEVVAFFSSESSHWVTGQVLRVNGGMA